LIREKRPFIALACCSSVDFVIEIGVLNMDFFGVDANDRAILVVELADLPDILASFNDIVVKFIPIDDC
jgi:hypothetical protein